VTILTFFSCNLYRFFYCAYVKSEKIGRKSTDQGAALQNQKKLPSPTTKNQNNCAPSSWKVLFCWISMRKNLLECAYLLLRVFIIYTTLKMSIGSQNKQNNLLLQAKTPKRKLKQKTRLSEFLFRFRLDSTCWGPLREKFVGYFSWKRFPLCFQQDSKCLHKRLNQIY